ncbi:MAG TPA: SRPBCC domain-containing protein [Candidatus Eisenbacteria bacterium]|nr:SRPBCC domain-containing protein [Candidatus Eisenbacteria bacterium]
MRTTTIEVNVGIGARPDRVFGALLDSSDLQAWFAESAGTSVRGRQYNFWGRTTPEAPGLDESHHELVDVQRDRKLSYRWKLRGADTRVDVTLEPDGSHTRVVLVHDDAPARRVEEGSLADWWGLSLENLKAWVERGRTGLKVDFTIPPELELRLEIDVEAKRALVFRALIDPKQIERWIGEPGHTAVEPRVGGRLDFGWGSEGGGPIRILSLQPDRELSYAWIYGQEPETAVTWSLVDSNGGTHVTLVHLGFVDTIHDRPYRTGWTKFLNRVKHMVESGASWKRAITVSHDYEVAR